MILQGYDTLTEQQGAKALAEMVSLPVTSPKVSQLTTVLQTINFDTQVSTSADTRRQHVVLILDKVSVNYSETSLIQTTPFTGLILFNVHSSCTNYVVQCYAGFGLCSLLCFIHTSVCPRKYLKHLFLHQIMHQRSNKVSFT